MPVVESSEYPTGAPPRRDDPARRRLMFLVTEDWYFCSHRLPIARGALAAGYDVTVVTRVNQHGDAIRDEGFRLVALPWRRKSRNPFRELRTVFSLIGILRRERPDILHNVAIKPVLYGSLAARFAGTRRVVNALAGLGYAVAGGEARASFLRRLFRLAFRWLLNGRGARVLVQNPDDAEALVARGTTTRDRITVIRGSGVDVERFAPSPQPPEPVGMAMVSRMVWFKGVREFVQAAARLRDAGAIGDAFLVGEPDDENPQSIPRAQLDRWNQSDDLTWSGRVEDIPGLWAKVHIAVLPSHGGEGVPKSLLEAAACGRPIVATDVPGCREIVVQGENGLLVPPRDVEALVDAVRTLVGDAELRARMGEKSRELVESQFAEARVVSQTLELYQSMLTGEGS